MKNSNDGKFWPYMILGFIAIGVTLGVWTVKNTISLPVHESNEFMSKYQYADKNYNEILAENKKFDENYSLGFEGLQKTNFKPKYLKRKPHQYFGLSDTNNFNYKVTTKNGKAVNDANVTLLVTRPQTEKDDIKLSNIKSDGNGVYAIKDLKITKPGRYILRVRVAIKDAIKYLDIYAVKPIKK